MHSSVHLLILMCTLDEKVCLAVEMIARTLTYWENDLKDMYQEVNCKTAFLLELRQRDQGHKTILHFRCSNS